MSDLKKREKALLEYYESYKVIGYSMEPMAFERILLEVSGKTFEVLFQRGAHDPKGYSKGEEKMTLPELLDFLYYESSPSLQEKNKKAHLDAVSENPIDETKRKYYTMPEQVFFLYLNDQILNQMKNKIRTYVKFSRFGKIEKKSMRSSFEMMISYQGKKDDLFVEYWFDRSFCKIYKGPDRLFFSEQIFAEVVETIRKENEFYKHFVLSESLNEVVNQAFNELIAEEVVKSDSYRLKKMADPNFEF